MSARSRLRLILRLYLPVLLTWLVVGILFAAVFAWVLPRPLREARRDCFAAEARAYAGLLRHDPVGTALDFLGPAFSRPRTGERWILREGGGKVWADSDQDSSLWLAPAGEAAAAVREWSLARVPDPRSLRRVRSLEARFAGRADRGPVELIWVRELPADEAGLVRIRRGLWTLWGLLGVVLAGAVWRRSGRIELHLGRVRRAIHRLGALDPLTPEELDGGRSLSRGDLLDLAADVERARSQVIREIGRFRNEELERDSIFEGMAEGLLVVDSRGVIQLLNRRACAMLSVPEPAPIGQRLAEVVRLSEVLRYVDEVMTSGEKPALELPVQGGRRTLRLSATVLRDPQGRAEALVLVLSDVTELRNLEQIRKEFVDNVSHELKTPLATLSASVETLLDGADEDPSARLRFLRSMGRNVERMNRIVEDLLSLSRIESQGRSIERQEIRLPDLADRVLDEVRPEAERLGVRLRAEVDAVQPPLLGNSFMIERALVNLLDNAIKYGGQGKEVVLRARRAGGSLLLTVSDRGPGIPAAHLPRLFERFYRVDRGRSRDLGGTGLGLAIVKHVALAHGGEATVESAPGQGSTFALRLPWVPAFEERGPGAADLSAPSARG